jgi:Na+-transporting NADH:ubiquinone oxidoreductase subunit B
MKHLLQQSWPALIAAIFPRGGSERLLAIFVSASVPAAMFALWHAGSELPPAQQIADWRQDGLHLLAGLRQFLPMLAIAALTAFSWERLFTGARKRAADAGWIMTTWLFVLLLPPATPLWLVCLGMSFGMVFGSKLFGGTGCYVASPALVGALFLHFSYPSLLADAPAWVSIASFSAGAGTGLLTYAFALTCAAGAFTLVASGAASARTLGGALLALLVAALFDNANSAAEHAAYGSFTFCWAFVLTDPTTQALTRAARWMHGAAFALLVVLIRAADPARPDGVLFAVLLAGLLVPLFDYLVLALHRKRRGTTLEVRR